MNDYLGVVFEKINDVPLTDRDVVFLCNHRTQADFFITDRVTGYKANILSRREVAYVFPMSAIVNPGSLWFFNRNNIQIDKYRSLDPGSTSGLTRSLPSRRGNL